jgi:MFS family permease
MTRRPPARSLSGAIRVHPGVTSSWFSRVLVTSLLVITAINAVRPAVSYRAIALGATPVEIGVVAGSYALLSFLVAVPIGRWVDRFGESRFLLAGAAVVALVSVALAGVTSIAGLIVAQAALGIGQVLCVVAAQSLVASGHDQTARDSRVGVFSVVVSLGLISGPALGGLVGGRSNADLTHVFGMSAGFALASTLAAASLWRWPPKLEQTAAAVTPSAAIPTAMGLSRLPGMPQAMLASLTVLATIDIVTAYLPAYGEMHGLAVGTIGWLLATQAASSMAARMLMLPLIRILGRRWLLASSMLVTASSLSALPLAGADTATLYVLMACGGTGLGLAQPITISWVAGRAPAGTRATALSMRMTANRLGQLLLPSAVGGIAGAAGVSAIFVSLGVLLTGSATFVLNTRFGEERSGEP